MEDINCWQSKYQSCEYSDRLMNKLYQMNQEVTRSIDLEEVRKGIYYAKKYHGSQIRQSGEPYYSHPIAVAYMVVEYTALDTPKFFRTDMIVTALLHDTIEDTSLTKSTIAHIFGNQVASQVEDLTRVKLGKKISATETLNLLYMHRKCDLILIKLLDRQHNLYTLGVKSTRKIKKTIEETLLSFITFALYIEQPIIMQQITKLCYTNIDDILNGKKSYKVDFNDNFQLPSLIS